MRAEFSASIQRKIEEATLVKKTTTRVLSLSAIVAILVCMLFLIIFDKPLQDFSDAYRIHMATFIFISVISGSIISLVVFFSISVHLRRIIKEMSRENPKWEWLENEYMSTDIHDAYIAIKKLHSEVSFYAKKAGISEIATQIAHDIRSPLIALEVAIRELHCVPHEQRNLIRSSVARIKDMANDLLISKKQVIEESKLANKNELRCIFQLISDLISEKKYEIDQSNILINLEVKNKSYDVFSYVDENQFKRMISNVINNSIEACGSNGKIEILLEKKNGLSEIIIKDNGCGIPQHILSKIRQKGFSHNKQNGNGLGLHYAEDYISSIGGELQLSSEIGKWTEVIIRIPTITPPLWFNTKIDLWSCTKIQILSDDSNFKHLIEDLLTREIREICALSLNLDVDIVDIEHDSELIIIDASKISKYANIIDYCVKNKSGSCNLLIVTDEYISSEFGGFLLKNNVNLLPKQLLVREGKKLFLCKNKCILLDNSQIILDAWKLRAFEKNVEFYGFLEIYDMLNFIRDCDKSVDIYIDYDLGRGLSGDKIACDLYEQGFENLFICTGFDKEDLKQVNFIKDIIGKEPPF